eukprot:2468495-Alexandrium_andersonii.AAC.1
MTSQRAVATQLPARARRSGIARGKCCATFVSGPLERAVCKLSRGDVVRRVSLNIPFLIDWLLVVITSWLEPEP